MLLKKVILYCRDHYLTLTLVLINFWQVGYMSEHAWRTPGTHPNARLVHAWRTPGTHPNARLVHAWHTSGARW
jgi:hypothetical protein